MRIALIGHGGVGQAFAKLLAEKRDYLAETGCQLTLTHIIDKENRADFDRLLKNREADLCVITTPTNKETGQPGYGYIQAALAHGLHVVTADKGPVLLAYHELKKMAAANGVGLGIGCTTGGALPAINSGFFDLAGASILSIEGVLNGTTNFILTEMREKQTSYARALQQAQNLGIAEADPSLDVEGFDTATKLLILTNVLLDERKTLADVKVRGITALTIADIQEATAAGQRYRLVGKSFFVQGRLAMTVEPLRLAPAHPFYHVEDKNKAVHYVTDTLGDLTVCGGASGVTPAAASLLRDIINIQRGYGY